MNRELAYRVLEQIEAHPDTHVQEKWRCQTGMCFAGWAIELSGYQWATDARDMFHSSYVLAPEGMRTEYLAVDLDDPNDGQVYRLPSPSNPRHDILLRQYQEQCDDVRYVEHVETLAAELLGLNVEQCDKLFAEDNKRPKLRRLVEKYFGPKEDVQ